MRRNVADDEYDEVVEIPMATVVVAKSEKTAKLKNGNSFSKKKQIGEYDPGNIPQPPESSGGLDLHKIGNNSKLKKKSSGLAWHNTTIETSRGDTYQYQNSDNVREIKLWPQKLKDQIVRVLKKPPNEDRANVFFEKYKWPIGLREGVT